MSGDVRLRPSNLVDDLRKLINNPAFADAVFPASLQLLASGGAVIHYTIVQEHSTSIKAEMQLKRSLS